MKITSKLILLILVFYTVGCSESPKTDDTPSKEIEEAKVKLNEASPKTNLPKADNLNKKAPATLETTEKTEVVKPSKNETALNPPHGEPGHDCAIPVGAPLNSKPQNTSTNGMQLSTQGPKKQQKLNPAHGLPGHDCTIPVGAPLN